MRFRKVVAWGAVDQGLSSLTNLAVTLFGARLIGPSGLGIVSVGFATYVFVLVVSRTLLSQPVILESTTAEGPERETSTRVGAAATIAVGLASTVIMLVVFALAPSSFIGRGALAFAPWMPAALLQDYWRSVLFRDHRGAASAANDLVWVVGMVVTLPLAIAVRTEVALVACWGLGATAAAAYGFVQARTRPAGPRLTWSWWRSGIGWKVGRWFTAEGIAFTGLSQAVTLVVAAMLGSAAVGGLRASRTAFAPLTLLGPAVVLPGLPAMVRALTDSLDRARALALRLSALLVAIAIPYLILVAVAGGSLLSFLFGDRFAGFGDLALPIAVQQLLAAAGMGLYLLLKAARQGKALLTFRLIEAAGTLVLVVALTSMSGLLGAAWAMTAGAAFGLAWKIHYVYRRLHAEAVPVAAVADGPGALSGQAAEIDDGVVD